MAITAEDVRKLREQTGAGMMDCKKALTESGGDFEKAVTILREKGIAIAAKRESRAASEGLIGCYVSDDSRVGSLVEVNCETTFVAKTDEFVNLTNRLAVQVAAGSSCGCCCCGGEALLDQPYIDEPSKPVKQYITELMGKIGEKIAVARSKRLAVGQEPGLIGSYVHMGSRIGVLVKLTCDSDAAAQSDDAKSLAKDLAMHVSWSRPDYLTREEVPADVIEKERDIHRQWAIKEGKPEKVIDRIVDGRMTEFYSRTCLMEQAFIKDEDQTIQKLVDTTAAKAGGKIAVAEVVRFGVGEMAGESD